jgi:(+)-trans-carveol dehydrogenase
MTVVRGEIHVADPQQRFVGKIAFVTGAARGQGRNHAIRLAQEGADIIALDLCGQIDSVPYGMSSPEDLAETVAAVESLDRRIVARQADTRDFSAVQAVVEEGVSALGGIDVIAASAGIVSFGSIVDLDPAVWQDTIDVNLTGVFNTLKAAAPALIERGPGGSAVVTSSIRGVSAMDNVAHYTASKYGVIGLTNTFARELGPRGIRANCIMPTQVYTDMILNEPTARLFCPAEENPTEAQMAVVSQSTHILPVPWIETDDVSNALLFLASEEARYITGVALPVDCGALLV